MSTNDESAKSKLPKSDKHEIDVKKEKLDKGEKDEKGGVKEKRTHEEGKSTSIVNGDADDSRHKKSSPSREKGKDSTSPRLSKGGSDCFCLRRS